MSSEAVICAGEIDVTDGDPRFISNETGHHKSTDREPAAALRYLGKRFVGRSAAIVPVHPEKKFFRATEWLTNYDRCNPMRYDQVRRRKHRLTETGFTRFRDP